MTFALLGVVPGMDIGGINEEALFRFLVGGALLILAIPFIFLGFSWYRKRLDHADANPDPNSMMEEFRQLRASGEMSEEEFRRVKAILGNEIRRATGDEKRPSPRFEKMTDETSDQEEYEWRDVHIEPQEPPSSMK